MDDTELLILAGLGYFLFLRPQPVHASTPAYNYQPGPQAAPQQSSGNWWDPLIALGAAAIGAAANGIGNSSGAKTDGDGTTYYPSSGFSVDAGADGGGYDPNDPVFGLA